VHLVGETATVRGGREVSTLVYREFVMGLVTALLIYGVMALVLYGAVRLYWDFMHLWDHAWSLNDPSEAGRRSKGQEQQDTPEQRSLPPRHTRPF
jgi:hypothetical protein